MQDLEARYFEKKGASQGRAGAERDMDVQSLKCLGTASASTSPTSARIDEDRGDMRRWVIVVHRTMAASLRARNT